jgi:hypothetical protein
MVSVCWWGRRDDVFCLWTMCCWIVLECDRCARMQAWRAFCEKHRSTCLGCWGARPADTNAGVFWQWAGGQDERGEAVVCAWTCDG